MLVDRLFCVYMPLQFCVSLASLEKRGGLYPEKAFKADDPLPHLKAVVRRVRPEIWIKHLYAFLSELMQDSLFREEK